MDSYYTEVRVCVCVFGGDGRGGKEGTCNSQSKREWEDEEKIAKTYLM